MRSITGLGNLVSFKKCFHCNDWRCFGVARLDSKQPADMLKIYDQQRLFVSETRGLQRRRLGRWDTQNCTLITSPSVTTWRITEEWNLFSIFFSIPRNNLFGLVAEWKTIFLCSAPGESDDTQPLPSEIGFRVTVRAGRHQHKELQQEMLQLLTAPQPASPGINNVIGLSGF